MKRIRMNRPKAGVLTLGICTLSAWLGLAGEQQMTQTGFSLSQAGSKTLAYRAFRPSGAHPGVRWSPTIVSLSPMSIEFSHIQVGETVVGSLLGVVGVVDLACNVPLRDGFRDRCTSHWDKV